MVYEPNSLYKTGVSKVQSEFMVTKKKQQQQTSWPHCMVRVQSQNLNYS